MKNSLNIYLNKSNATRGLWGNAKLIYRSGNNPRKVVDGKKLAAESLLAALRALSSYCQTPTAKRGVRKNW